jgi:hypothetical protein
MMTAVKTLLKVLFGVFGFLFLIGLLMGDKDASPATSTATAATGRPSGTQGEAPALVAQATTVERPASESPMRSMPTTAPGNLRAHATMVTRWGVNTLPIMQTITEDLRTVTEAARSMDFTGMVQGCRTLKLSVDRLRNVLPAPDSELDSALSAAASDFMEAADHCIRGGTSFNPDEIQEAGKHMTAGSGHINQASERAKELGRYIQ